MLTKKYLSQPTAIASYDYTDLITGKAYKTFYGINGIASYVLIPVAADTHANDATTEVGITTISSAITTYAKGVDVDFDMTVGIPQIIEGMAILNATVGSVGTNTKTIKLVGQILKNGVHLVSGSTTNMAQAAANPSSVECALNMDIPKTSFKVGDVLRLTCEVWGSSGASAFFGLAHDGRDRNDNKAATHKTIDDAHSTQLKLFLPFNPDL